MRCDLDFVLIEYGGCATCSVQNLWSIMFKALNLSNVPFLVLVDLCDIYFFLEACVYKFRGTRYIYSHFKLTYMTVFSSSIFKFVIFVTFPDDYRFRFLLSNFSFHLLFPVILWMMLQKQWMKLDHLLEELWEELVGSCILLYLNPDLIKL